MSQPEAELVPLSALTESEHLYRLLVLCFGVWLYAADSTLVATVMPVAVEDIGGLPYLSWTYTLYQLGSVVTGAIAGLVVMRTGIVRTEIAAGILYVLGCALSGYAPDMTTMIVGRILQGMGGGALVSLAFIGASTLFPQKMWVRVIAVISGIWGISSLCGPLIGGYFVSGGNWRGGNCAAADFSQAGRGQQKPHLSQGNPGPSDCIRFRVGDDVGPLHGNHLTDRLWTAADVYNLRGSTAGCWLRHCS